MPDIFLNSNGYNLGTNEEGQLLGDVLLPPWAKSPEDFVRLNRMVSANELSILRLVQLQEFVPKSNRHSGTKIAFITAISHLAVCTLLLYTCTPRCKMTYMC